MLTNFIFVNLQINLNKKYSDHYFERFFKVGTVSEMFLTVFSRSAIMNKKAAIPTTFESKSSVFIIVIESPAV